MAGINKLFKNESKLMLILLAGSFFVGLILVFIFPFFYNESSIDACLDTGGSFNYELCECDLGMSHIVPMQHNCK